MDCCYFFIEKVVRMVIGFLFKDLVIFFKIVVCNFVLIVCDFCVFVE